MRGYLIANLDIHDQPTFQRYREEVVPLIARYGGRYIVRGGEVESLEGDLGFKRLIVLEFPTLDAARAFLSQPRVSTGESHSASERRVATAAAVREGSSPGRVAARGCTQS